MEIVQPGGGAILADVLGGGRCQLVVLVQVGARQLKQFHLIKQGCQILEISEI